MTLCRMHYLVRVPFYLVCFFANCTNHSATLVSLDFTTSYTSVIFLTPVRRRKLSVDRAEVALKLSHVSLRRLFRL